LGAGAKAPGKWVWGREADGLLRNKKGSCDVKMHTNVNFCLNFVITHNAASRAKITQSTYLYLSV